MPAPTSKRTPPTALIVAAGRGLGRAVAEQFLDRGWQVIGTVRPGRPRSGLHELAETAGGRLEIETLDIDEPDQIAALRGRLDGRVLDVLFVNAGITTRDEHIPVGEVTTEEFNAVMLTNALSPMRVIESLQDLVTPTGLIGAMSSGQGSIANNETGRREVYRGSKAALNQFMRSFAVRQPEPARTLLVLAPGWIRTELGGPDAPLGIEDSIPRLVDVMLAQLGTPGVQFLDYQGRTVPW
ncbi:SDR family oxidoreductase [Streptomyces sp. WP-1]|uniref:SDR family oxidoreductase n=1 Tax=Streptomyces sp. WP-1 TaxID=3041497 RepID=UPI0026488E05|nr:SDR family oxidoreductase [Streptomyces sp. WP-1]WKE68912.1 SDR family oxidoreductase [Streptomyces sp. WP-1]